MLTSDEWVMIKPTGGATSIIGDTIMIDANTDIDSIVVSWGDSIKHQHKLLALGLNSKVTQTFQAWRVVEAPETAAHDYTMKMAHIVVSKAQKLKEDRVLLDPE